MATQLIQCPNCGHQFEPSEGISDQEKAKLKAVFEKEHQIHIEELERTLKAREEKLEEFREKELELRDEKRKLEDRAKDMELEVARKLDWERKQIEETVFKQAAEEHYHKDREKDQKLADMEKLVVELKRKAEQGSMQTQGEVAELDLEELLKNNFRDDEIEPIGKGTLGADIRQVVKSPKGTICGVILWESKRTKAWSDGWIDKLKMDLRQDKADLPALVTTTMPKSIDNNLGIYDGVWVTTPGLVLPLAMLLRKTLLDAAKQKYISANRQTTAEELYGYVTSLQFSQQVETMVESYLEMKQQIVRERTTYEKLWAARETQVNRLLTGVSGIYGNIQGIAGSSLPVIKTLELSATIEE